MPIKRLTPNRHLQLIERILHHKIRIQLINLLHNHIYIHHERIRKQQELGPRLRLETREPELVRLEELQPGRGHGGDGVGVGGGRCICGWIAGVVGCCWS